MVADVPLRPYGLQCRASTLALIDTFPNGLIVALLPILL